MNIQLKKEEKKSFAENVEIRNLTVKDMVRASAVSGETKGLKYMLACLAEIALFDGVKKTMEDLFEMNSEDFFSLQQGLESLELKKFSEQLSSAKEEEPSLQNI